MKYKICSKCKAKHLATLKHFGPDNRKRDGFQSQCRKCRNTYLRKYSRTKRCKAVREKYRSSFEGHLRSVYYNIKRRCDNPKAARYERYGGRGIKCLFKSVNEFVNYVINKLQIDRIDNNGHYEKGNIRFVTAKVNANNRENNIK